jgi:Rap1a immunity proteins
MKPSLCAIAIFCLLSVATFGQHEKSKPKPLDVPVCFIKSEQFDHMREDEKLTYTAGLMDGFYASALFGANEEAVAHLNSCTKQMAIEQISAITAKYVKDHPEEWHLPLSVAAYNALNDACPRQHGR